MREEWRPVRLGILALESNYEVSSLGRVRNRKTGRVLSSHFITNRSGDLYEKVDLYLAGIRHKRFVHRLVAEQFIPNPENKPEVNHPDGNTLNNGKDNVEWATREENEAHKRFMRATA
jgi:hypothetical protein